MKRESDRKCVSHARVHASAQSFDRCEGQLVLILVPRAHDPSVLWQESRALGATILNPV